MSIPIRHPYTAMSYELVDRNRIQITDGNRTGLFDADGTWLEGDIKSADPCFCRFLASGWVMDERRREWGRAYR